MFGRWSGSLVCQHVVGDIACAREWVCWWRVGQIISPISPCRQLLTRISILDAPLEVGMVVRLMLWMFYLLSKAVSILLWLMSLDLSYVVCVILTISLVFSIPFQFLVIGGALMILLIRWPC